MRFERIRCANESDAMNIIGVSFSVLLLTASLALAVDEGSGFNWNRARELHQRQQQGKTLTTDEQAYIQKAMELHRHQQQSQQQNGGGETGEPPPWSVPLRVVLTGGRHRCPS